MTAVEAKRKVGMSHWWYYGSALLNLLLYVYSEPRPMLLVGFVVLVVYGTGERVVNHLKATHSREPQLRHVG